MERMKRDQLPEKVFDCMESLREELKKWDDATAISSLVNVFLITVGGLKEKDLQEDIMAHTARVLQDIASDRIMEMEQDSEITH